MDYGKLLKLINHEFKDVKLIETAFTHSSFVHENKSQNQGGKTTLYSNERIEFLGDAVLEIVISDHIYKNFPDMPEGEMTKFRASIVCAASLSEAAKNLNLGSYLKLGKGEELTGGRTRDSILADCFEAVIGSIYVDGGIEPAQTFILNQLKNNIVHMEDKYELVDCKTYLQEYIQKTSKIPLVYEIIDEKGPEHNKVFVARITHMDKILGEGEGHSKKEAEQEAAKNSLKKLEELKNGKSKEK